VPPHNDRHRRVPGISSQDAISLVLVLTDTTAATVPVAPPTAAAAVAAGALDPVSVIDAPASVAAAAAAAVTAVAAVAAVAAAPAVVPAAVAATAVRVKNYAPHAALCGGGEHVAPRGRPREATDIWVALDPTRRHFALVVITIRVSPIIIVCISVFAYICIYHLLRLVLILNIFIFFSIFTPPLKCRPWIIAIRCLNGPGKLGYLAVF
jgi:hypothetical protein